MQYWIGQAFGILATVIGILIPVFKKKWQMLVLNIANNLMLALNLVFLDQIGSGIFLFAVAITQGIVNLVHTLRNTKGKLAENVVFLVLYLALGFYGLASAPGFVPTINPQNLLELLPIVGAVLSMCFISVREERLARVFYLGCSAAWAVYYAIIWSSSFFGSFFSIITGVIAIWKDAKKKAYTEK